MQRNSRTMKAYKDDDYNGRLTKAANAKMVMILRHRAKAGSGVAIDAAQKPANEPTASADGPPGT